LNQGYILALMLYCGAALGALFDVCLCLRKILPRKVNMLADLLFGLLFCFAIGISLYLIVDLRIRLFYFLAVAFGFFLWEVSVKPIGRLIIVNYVAPFVDKKREIRCNNTKESGEVGKSEHTDAGKK